MKTPTNQIEINGITLNVPTGSMDAPTREIEAIVNAMQDQNNWKNPTTKFVTMSYERAQEVAYGLDWFLGGHEININGNGQIEVTSKGYYHYIGA